MCQANFNEPIPNPRPKTQQACMQFVRANCLLVQLLMQPGPIIWTFPLSPPNPRCKIELKMPQINKTCSLEFHGGPMDNTLYIILILFIVVFFSFKLSLFLNTVTVLSLQYNNSSKSADFSYYLYI